MAFYFNIHILSLLIIFLISMVHSFVLLTANVEDVKNLAKKFVSESLAEQIANVLVQLSANRVESVSEENERNLDLDRQSSKEDSFHNNKQILRQNPSIKNSAYLKPRTTKTPVNRFIQKHDDKTDKRPHTNNNRPTYNIVRPNNYKTAPRNHNNWATRKTNSPPNSRFKIEKQTPKNNDFKKFRPVYRKPNRQQVRKHITKLTKLETDLENEKVDNANIPSGNYEQLQKHLDAKIDQNKIANEPTDYNSGNPSRERVENQNTNNFPVRQSSTEPTASTKDYAEEVRSDDNPAASQHFFDGINSNVVNKDYDNPETRDNLQKPALRYAGLNIETTGLTTEKERNEFDQYDNRNYPKSQFVATSGSVSLPKVHSYWMEKDEGGAQMNEDTGKKAWF